MPKRVVRDMPHWPAQRRDPWAQATSEKARTHVRNGRRQSTNLFLRVFATEVRAWYGREPLWKVFWGYGVLASSVVIGLYAIATMQGRIVVEQILLIFFAGYTVWILVAVWRCAEASDPLWRTLARSLTVAWAGNTALVVFFLQLEILLEFLSR